jgi:hypothetical protein
LNKKGATLGGDNRRLRLHFLRAGQAEGRKDMLLKIDISIKKQL